MKHFIGGGKRDPLTEHHQLKKVIVCEQVQTGEAEKNAYLTLYRLQLKNAYRDGSFSEEYSYDAVLRKWLDAVVMILFTTINGKLHICLRACIRPPLLIRHQRHTPIAETGQLVYLWELPAGLLEDDDVGEAGILQRAHKEILEETGYWVPPIRIKRMRSAPFLNAGVIPERIWYTFAEIVDPKKRSVPKGDGSAIEENSAIKWVELESALTMCEDGTIDDMKTELGIRKFACYLQGMEKKNE